MARKKNSGHLRNSGTQGGGPVEAEGQRIRPVALVDLHFDETNPRFAGSSKTGESESQILNEIVKTFGVNDVISSIAMNGYLETEPLVGVQRGGGGIRVLEGNRRLAALLILAGDDRARDQSRLRDQHPLANGVAVDEVPVVVYDEGTEPSQLLPYLGVRHIVGPKPWDSYAKAAWVAHMLEKFRETITLQQIEQMMGDTRGTIRRMLEGYYVVDQIRESQLFNFDDSTKQGRGTAASFPFSWVYNILGYTSTRNWIGMDAERLTRNPIHRDKIRNAADLMVFMFGQKLGKKSRAIGESRGLGDLAKCLANSSMIARLRNGESVEQVLWVTKQGVEKVLERLTAADKALTDAAGAVSELNQDDAKRAWNDADKVAKRARSVYKAISERMTVSDDDVEQ
jgi:hypothetical protein